MKKILIINGHGKWNGCAIFKNKGDYFYSDEYGTHKISEKKVLELGMKKETVKELRELLFKVSDQDKNSPI